MEFFKNCIQLMSKIVQLLESIISHLCEKDGQDLASLLDKYEVMKMLKISDSTYRRYVKNGVLEPMKLDGIDMYFKKDILSALERSRRKGK